MKESQTKRLRTRTNVLKGWAKPCITDQGGSSQEFAYKILGDKGNIKRKNDPKSASIAGKTKGG